MDDLILCLVWSHPKAVNHFGILLAGRVRHDKMWMAVALAVLAGAWMTMGSHASIPQSVEVPSNASTENLGGRYLSAVPAEGFVLRRSRAACCLLPGSESPHRQLVQLVRLCPRGTSQAFLYPPRRTYFLLFFRISTPQSPTPPTGLSKQPPPFQMLMLFSWLNCGPDHELGVNQYSLSMLIYTHWEFPFLHHLAKLYDMSFISPHSLACHSPFLAPEPPASLWTPCRFGI